MPTFLGSVHKYFGGGAGQNGGGAKKVLSCRKGGTKKFSVVKGGGSKKFGQIESIMNVKMHNLVLKLTGYISSNWIYISKFSRALQRARHCNLRLKCLHLHSLTNSWHLFREPCKLRTIIQRVVVGYVPFRV